MAGVWEIGLVLAGAIVGFVPAVALERMKWRHEQRQAWHVERRTVYAEFLVRVSSLEHDTVQLAREVSRPNVDVLTADALRHPGAVENDVLRELVRDRNAVAENMITTYETLKLIAGAAPLRLAQEIVDRYNSLLVLARDGTFEPEEAWVEARQRLRSAQRDFRDAARKELMAGDAGRG